MVVLIGSHTKFIAGRDFHVFQSLHAELLIRKLHVSLMINQPATFSRLVAVPASLNAPVDTVKVRADAAYGDTCTLSVALGSTRTILKDLALGLS
jgi:hypothetical protein